MNTAISTRFQTLGLTKVAVLGLGKTGQSCLAFLATVGCAAIGFDTKMSTEAALAIQAQYPTLEMHFGAITTQALRGVDLILTSPGVDLNAPEFQELLATKIPRCGDLELFAKINTMPVLAITGSNGKTTVTHMVTEMARASGLRPVMLGNVGIPALSVLGQDFDLVVLECSSFQLGELQSLEPQVGAFLNLSPDHLDRHQTMAAYQKAKLRVYHQAAAAVFYRDDAMTLPPETFAGASHSFALTQPAHECEWGLLTQSGIPHLALGDKVLLPVNALPCTTKPHLLNALAASAIANLFGIAFAAIARALQDFCPLPHRIQPLGKVHDIEWFNDSKATNVGAAIVAIEALAPANGEYNLLLLAGGRAKGADFSEFAKVVAKHVATMIVYGEAQEQLLATCSKHRQLLAADSLEHAVTLAYQAAHPGDKVLLAPACASLDSFRNYEHRGEAFMAAVAALS